MVSAPPCSGAGGRPPATAPWTGRSLLKATRCQVSDVRRLEDASLSYSSLHGWEERGRLDDFLVADAALLADPGLRRLLVLHAAGRGRRGHRRRAGARPLRHGRAGRDRARGGRPLHLAGRRATAPSAATPWPPTATCTRRRCRSWARCPTMTTTRTGSRPGPGSVLRAAAAHRRVIPSPERSPVQRPVGSLPSSFQPFGRSRCGSPTCSTPSQPGRVTITPDAGVRELIAKLAEHNVGALIVSADGQSRRRHRQRARRRTPPPPRRHRRQQHRRRDHDRGRRDLRAQDTLRRPDEDHDRRRIRHVPVVKDGKLVGIICIGDVVKHQHDQLEFERDQLDTYVHQT